MVWGQEPIANMKQIGQCLRKLQKLLFWGASMPPGGIMQTKVDKSQMVWGQLAIFKIWIKLGKDYWFTSSNL